MGRPASPPFEPNESRVVELPTFGRAADVAPSSVNEAARTVDVVFSTGAAVERMDWWTGQRYIEKLSMNPKAVRLDRLNSGAPLLDSHGGYSVRDQLGSVVAGSAAIVQKEGRARVRFSRRPEIAGVWQDVIDGHVRNVSVGYRVYKFEEEKGADDKLPIRTAIDWEPYEISMVPMPADAKAQTRGDKPTTQTYPCEIVTRLLADASALTLTDADRRRTLQWMALNAPSAFRTR